MELNFEPEFVCLSLDFNHLFTMGKESIIQRFDLETGSLISTYNRDANALAFLDDNWFVSISFDSSNAFVWNVNEEEPHYSPILENDMIFFSYTGSMNESKSNTMKCQI